MWSPEIIERLSPPPREPYCCLYSPGIRSHQKFPSCVSSCVSLCFCVGQLDEEMLPVAFNLSISLCVEVAVMN